PSVPAGGAVADHRPGETVRVVVEAAEAGALGAEEALAERVFLVAAHREHAVLGVEGDLEPADRLAERAGAQPGSAGLHNRHHRREAGPALPTRAHSSRNLPSRKPRHEISRRGRPVGAGGWWAAGGEYEKDRHPCHGCRSAAG